MLQGDQNGSITLGLDTESGLFSSITGATGSDGTFTLDSWVLGAVVGANQVGAFEYGIKPL